MTLIASKETDSLLETASAYPDNTAPKATETSVFIGKGPVLKNWKISTNPAETEEDRDNAQSEPEQDSEFEDETVASTAEAISAIERNISSRQIKTPAPVAPFWLQVAQAASVFLTVGWITYAGLYFVSLPGGIKSMTASPLAIGLVLACIMTPVALLWLSLSAWQRRSDAHMYAYALKQELRGLLFPSEDQSHVINQDLQHLVKQASEISALSRGTLKAIQRARTGLRTEIRDFSGVTQKAEFHIDRLADSLSKRAEELLSLTETIEAQTDVISQKATRGIQSWENVSAEVAELGDEIDNLFSGSTEKLTLAATRLEETRGKIDLDAARIEQTVGKVAEGADRLERSLENAESFSDSITRAAGAMDENLQKIEGTSADLYAKTKDLAEKLGEQASSLSESTENLLNATSELEKVGDLASHKLSESLEIALSGADNISSSLKKSKDLIDRTVTESASAIEQSTRHAEERMRKISDESEERIAELTRMIEELDRQAKEIRDTRTGLQEEREASVQSYEKTLEILERAAVTVQKRTEEPIELITKSLDRMEEQTARLDEKLSVRIVELEQSQSRIRESVDTVTTTLDNTVTTSSTAADRIETQVSRITDQIDLQKTALTELVDELETRTSEIANLLADQSQSLTNSLEISESQIGLLGQAFFEKTDDLTLRITEAAGTLSLVEQGAIDSIDHARNALTAGTRSFAEQIDILSELAEKSEPECSRMVAAAEALEAKYARMREMYVATTSVAQDSLEETAESLDSRLEKLRAGIEQSILQIGEQAETLDDRIHQIGTQASAASREISQAESALAHSVTRFENSTAQIGETTATVKDGLENCIETIAALLNASTGSLEESIGKLDESTEELNRKVDLVRGKIEDSAASYKEEAQRMALFGEQAVHKSSRIVSFVREEAGKMAESVQHSLLNLQKSGETISARTREIEAHIKASLESAGSCSDELRRQVTDIAGTSEEIVDRIEDATGRLATRIHDVRLAGATAGDAFDTTRQKLAEEGTKMVAVTKKAIEAAEEATSVFSRNSTNLYRSVQEIADQAKKLKDTQLRNERESFLTASRFVVESLYSLSVDISRHLGDDMDPRVLRAYQRGDISAFAKHLVDSAQRIPLDRAQRRFIEDSEFRTYTLRFIRQYEELVEQAKGNDYGELMSSLFTTSDIGKLHKILSEIAGRDDR